MLLRDLYLHVCHFQLCLHQFTNLWYVLGILLILLLGRIPRYKIGILCKSQMEKRGLLRVRYMLAESGT